MLTPQPIETSFKERRRSESRTSFAGSGLLSFGSVLAIMVWLVASGAFS